LLSRGVNEAETYHWESDWTPLRYAGEARSRQSVLLAKSVQGGRVAKPVRLPANFDPDEVGTALCHNPPPRPLVASSVPSKLLVLDVVRGHLGSIIQAANDPTDNVAVDLIVVPVPPSPLAIRANEDVIAHLRRRHGNGPRVLSVLSMLDLRRKLHREMVAAHPDWLVIPQASAIERMSVERAPVATFAPRHPAARAFADLWAQVEGCLLEMEGEPMV
jgi:hypothetical protein